MPDERHAAGPASKSFSSIVDEEVARRKVLYQSALTMLEPVIELLRNAEEYSDVSLELYPPATRNSKIVCGKLQCRDFQRVGKERYVYDIVVTPEEGTCKLSLPSQLSDREAEDYYEEHHEWPGLEWTGTYWAADRNRKPIMSDLRNELEEALKRGSEGYEA